MHADFYRGLLVGLLVLGTPTLGVRCFSVQPAHADAQSQIEAQLVRQTDLLRAQNAILEKLVRATEKCK